MESLEFILNYYNVAVGLQFGLPTVVLSNEKVALPPFRGATVADAVAEAVKYVEREYIGTIN